MEVKKLIAKRQSRRLLVGKSFIGDEEKIIFVKWCGEEERWYPSEGILKVRF